MSRYLNPRKKFRRSRADEESGYITLRDGYATAIFQRPDGKFDVYGDTPEGQGAFIGTYRGLNGAEAAFRANEKVMAAFSRRARAAFDASRWRQSPMFALRSNPSEEVRQNLLDALRTLRTAQQEAREGRLFVASGTLRSVGMKLAFLFSSEDNTKEMASDPAEFFGVLRDIRDWYGISQAGILYGTTLDQSGVNAMVRSITTLMGDIESLYVLLFGSRPPR